MSGKVVSVIGMLRQLTSQWSGRSSRSASASASALVGKEPPTCSTSPASSKLWAITTQSPFRLKKSLGSATKHNLFTCCPQDDRNGDVSTIEPVGSWDTEATVWTGDSCVTGTLAPVVLPQPYWLQLSEKASWLVFGLRALQGLASAICQARKVT